MPAAVASSDAAQARVAAERAADPLARDQHLREAGGEEGHRDQEAVAHELIHALAEPGAEQRLAAAPPGQRRRAPARRRASAGTARPGPSASGPSVVGAARAVARSRLHERALAPRPEQVVEAPRRRAASRAARTSRPGARRRGAPRARISTSSALPDGISSSALDALGEVGRVEQHAEAAQHVRHQVVGEERELVEVVELRRGRGRAAPRRDRSR